MFRENDAIYNPSCAYVLLSIGRASIEQGVEMMMPAWGEAGTITYPNGVAITVHNRRVLVLRPIGYKQTPLPTLAGVTPSDLGIPVEGNYVLYLGSGPQKDTDVDHQLQGMRATVRAVMIDIRIGGTAHDLTRRPVAAALISAARDGRCVGVIASIRCKTWSVATIMPCTDGRPGKPYRDCDHILGIPDDKGGVPPAVVEANLETEHTTEIIMAALSHGGFVMAEQPARRTPETASRPEHVIPGCERSVHMFDHPAWKLVAEVSGARETTWDQCRLAEDPSTCARKTSVWLASPPVLEPVVAYFSHLDCNHAAGTHLKLKGVDDKGEWTTRTSAAETFSPATNKLIARCVTMAIADKAPALVAGVIQGKSVAKHSVTHDLIHQAFNHAEARVLRHLPDALGDVPEWWRGW